MGWRKTDLSIVIIINMNRFILDGSMVGWVDGRMDRWSVWTADSVTRNTWGKAQTENPKHAVYVLI